MGREKQFFKDKMQEYENQIKRLYFEVKCLRKKLGKYENSDGGENSGDMQDFMLFESSVQSERSDVIDLREKIRLLVQENLGLREQNERLQRSLQEAEGEFFKESRKKIHHLNLNKKQLME
jgi:regulator of replication initiation timing